MRQQRQGLSSEKRTMGVTLPWFVLYRAQSAAKAYKCAVQQQSTPAIVILL